MFWKVFIMSTVGAAIGWFTNYLAVKLIFRPLQPVKIPLVGLQFQGLIPKRRSEIAASIGKTVEEELLSIHELIEQLVTEDNQEVIISSIRTKVLTAIDSRIPGLVPRGIREAVLRYAGDVVEKEANDFFNCTIEDLILKVTEKISIRELVENKLNEFDLGELERLILSISHRELRYIEILGGVLGFFIGLAQGILLEVLK